MAACTRRVAEDAEAANDDDASPSSSSLPSSLPSILRCHDVKAVAAVSVGVGVV